MPTSIARRRRAHSAPLTPSQVNLVIVGDSITGGAGVLPYYPTQLGNMWSASGGGAITNCGHSGYSYVTGAPGGSLYDLYEAEVKPHLVAGKSNVLVMEGINDLYNGVSVGPPAIGETAVQYIAAVTAYAQRAMADGWTVILVEPTPRANTGTPASYETQRQLAITSLRASAVGTICAGLVRVGDDPRIGLAGSENNSYFYAADLVHLGSLGNAILAAAVMAELRTLFGFPWLPAHVPYVITWLDTSIADACTLATVPAVNGGAVDTVANQAIYNATPATQGTSASRPIFTAAAINGQPALAMGPQGGVPRWMEVVNYPRGVGTVVLVAAPSAEGYGYFSFGTFQWALNLVTTHTSGLATVNHGVTSQYVAASGTLGIGTGPHVYVMVGDGQHADTTLTMDGASVALSTFNGDAGNPGEDQPFEGATGGGTLFLPGNGGDPGAPGYYGFALYTPIPLVASELAPLLTYLSATWGIPT